MQCDSGSASSAPERGPMASRSQSSRREIQEVTLDISHQTSPSRSALETLMRPVPTNMTPGEASFHRQAYAPRSLPQPYLIVSSPVPSHNMHSLHTPPPYVPKSPSHFRFASSLPHRPPIGSKVIRTLNGNGPHPLRAVPGGMMIRKPEPISWIKYPVEPHRIYPGPYAAVDVPFEDVDNTPSFEVPKRCKPTMPSTWGPQKLKLLEKSRKCVRFASTWGPTHPGATWGPAHRGAGEYATINPNKLTSRYVRPAIFRRSNLKIDLKYE